MPKDCIFCKIVKGEIPSAKVWENKSFLAILDICPNTKGMTLVLPKKHYSSDVFQMQGKEYRELLLAARTVARLLKKKLKVKRVALVMEGMGVNHAHLKLYPLYGLSSKFTPMSSRQKVFFKKYPGYITTKLGPQKSMKELEKLAKKLRS